EQGSKSLTRTAATGSQLSNSSFCSYIFRVAIEISFPQKIPSEYTRNIFRYFAKESAHSM
ncbi:MAG: hypothetical protein ACK56I_22210, partial [bacterium]